MNAELARQRARILEVRARIHAGAVPDLGICLRPPKPVVAPPLPFREMGERHVQHVRDYQRVLRARGAVGARVEDVLEVVSEVFGVPTADLKAPTQVARIVRPRHVAAYLCRSRTTRPFAEIGRGLGGRDHATIVKACRYVEAELELGRDAKLERQVAACLRRLGLDADVRSS